MSSSRHGLIALRRHINLPFADGTTANIVMVDVRHHRYWRRFTARTVDNTGIGNSNRATARTECRSRLRQQARHDRRAASFGISCCFFLGSAARAATRWPRSHGQPAITWGSTLFYRLMHSEPVRMSADILRQGQPDPHRDPSNTE